MSLCVAGSVLFLMKSFSHVVQRFSHLSRYVLHSHKLNAFIMTISFIIFISLVFMMSLKRQINHSMVFVCHILNHEHEFQENAYLRFSCLHVSRYWFSSKPSSLGSLLQKMHLNLFKYKDKLEQMITTAKHTINRTKHNFY